MSGHPLKALKQELRVHGQCEELLLGFLAKAEVSQYLATRFPQRQFPPELERLLHRSTEGNPLFMVNGVAYWESQRLLVEADEQWRVAEVYGWFTEGVDTTDLQAARVLLEELAQASPGQI